MHTWTGTTVFDQSINAVIWFVKRLHAGWDDGSACVCARVCVLQREGGGAVIGRCWRKRSRTENTTSEWTVALQLKWLCTGISTRQKSLKVTRRNMWSFCWSVFHVKSSYYCFNKKKSPLFSRTEHFGKEWSSHDDGLLDKDVWS